jgi:hypothetical protein
MPGLPRGLALLRRFGARGYFVCAAVAGLGLAEEHHACLSRWPKQFLTDGESLRGRRRDRPGRTACAIHTRAKGEPTVRLIAPQH